MFSRPDSLFQAIADNASVALFMMDARQHCVFMNPAAVRLTGYRLDEVSGRPLHDFIHHLRPDGTPYPLSECPIDRAFPEENRTGGEEVFVHKDGHFYHVAFTASPLRDEGGRPHGTIIEVRDISARREQQAREARTQQLFVHLVQRAPFGIYIVDADLRLVLMNEGSKENAFRHVPQPVGWALMDAMRVLWPEPVAQEVVGRFQRTLDTGEPYSSADFRNPRRDVTAIEAYEWELQRITLPDGGVGVVCYYFDSTRLRDAEMALREADKAKDEFLAMLAHELRNPLAPIRTAVALQRTRPVSDPLLNRCRDVIDRQVTHMARLMDDLLDVSRLGRGKLVLQREVVPLGTILDVAEETSRPEIERHQCTLEVRTSDIAGVAVNGDPARLTQVFANLLNNAAKYNRPGGSITVSAEVEGDGEGREAVITIADTGCGIAPEFVPRLFELFAQASGTPGAAASGLGIGLHLSKRIVELHGGRIEASSEGAGLGSQFIVTLPVVASAIRTIADEQAPALTPVHLRMLVAEDNLDGAEMLTAFLQSAGCEVTCVADGQSALDVAERFRPEAVVLDIGMPGMDGYDVCERLRSTPWGTSITIVAMTGWGQPDDRRRSQMAGFDLHLVKPVDPRLLLTRITELRSASTGTEHLP